MAGMAGLIARKSPKLLAQAGQVLNQMVSEGLCDEPQKKFLQALLEARTSSTGCSKKSDFVSSHWLPRLRTRDCARRSATAGAGLWPVGLGA
jgi:hypothetical protein